MYAGRGAMAGQQEVRVTIPRGQKPYTTTFKVLIIGDTSVGKTALLNRFSDGSFHPSLVSTVGIDHKNRVLTVDGESVKLQIWDTAGQERFRTLTHAYFRGADGALLLYDISKRESYLNVAGWMDSVQTHATGIQIVIVGHKCDLEDQRNVSVEEGKKLAENYECRFIEVSAKSGTNCSEVFTLLAELIKEGKDRAASEANAERLKDSQPPFPLESPPFPPRDKNVCC